MLNSWNRLKRVAQFGIIGATLTTPAMAAQDPRMTAALDNLARSIAITSHH